MKAALILANGFEQIVLTPESPAEREALVRIVPGPRTVHVDHAATLVRDLYANKVGDNISEPVTAIWLLHDEHVASHVVPQ